MTGSARSALTTLQAVVVVALVVVVAGGGYWWYLSSLRGEPEPSPPVELPTNYLRYSRFGFSFDYPEGMEFTAGALQGGFDHAHLYHGDVQGVLEELPESFGVIWATFEEEPTLEALLDELFRGAVEAGDLQDLERGEIATVLKDGREVVSQGFNCEEDGTDVDGSVALWYESGQKRIYAIYLISPSAVGLDVQSRLESYLGSFGSEDLEPPAEVVEPYWPTGGWRITTPENVGMNSSRLEEMVQYVNHAGIGADSVMVIRDGYVVLDAYFPPFDEGELHIVYSCTKSVVSTLIGIAVEEGHIGSLDQRLLEFFPDRAVANMSQWKEEITLRDLLTMSAGFDARDSWLYEWEWLDRMHDAEDAAQYVLDLGVIEEPGARFEYTNGVSHLLSCIVTETTGMSALEYARGRLFEPLGIAGVEWANDTMGRNWGYSGLYLTPHDMAKFGYLFLNEGEWDGRRIVSREWVEDATSRHLDGNLMPGYGYQWWVSPDGYYTAIGYKG